MSPYQDINKHFKEFPEAAQVKYVTMKLITCSTAGKKTLFFIIVPENFECLDQAGNYRV